MTTLEQTIEKILSTRRITRNDQTLIMTTFAKKTLSPKDAALINRVHDALHQGRLRVVD
ncbi:hypothetical protein H6G13_13365 [Pseudanabaena sp. FACHB-2040]|nr:hypothetical protein [Pseudanabaena sp. FACHB-2040]